MKHCLTPIRMAMIKKSRNDKCWQGCGEKGTLVQCWWECKLVQPLRKNRVEVLQKLKTELLHDPVLGESPKSLNSGSIPKN